MKVKTPVPGSTRALCEFSGATYRQIDYWARTGILIETAMGSGTRRSFPPSEFEVAAALVALFPLGLGGGGSSHGRPRYVEPAVALVRAHRVDPAGEILVCRSDGRVERHTEWCARPADLAAGLLLVVLRRYRAPGEDGA